MTTLDHRMIKQRIPRQVQPTERHLDAPADWRVVLANDALADEVGTANKCRYLARQASRRWLSVAQRDTEHADIDQSRLYLAGLFTAADLPCRRAT